MSIFSSYKKIFLLGFIIVILLAIPFSVYIAQKRQQTTIQAVKSTTLSIDPAQTSIKVGDTLTLDIVLDPGTGATANQVSFVKLSISFDASKFSTANNSLAPNPDSPNTLTSILEDPVYGAGKASISLSIGADPTKVVTTKTKIAKLQLKALVPTTVDSPSSVTFAGDTQVLSIASTDQTSENVLSTTVPSRVTIASSATAPTPTSAASPGSPGSPSVTPTRIPSAPTLPPSFGSIGNAPVCSNLSVDSLTTGVAPYTLTFTAVGSDSDGTINKISFNFGDTIEALTFGGGIGTSTVSGQIVHTYNTPGIYTAYAILTDNANNLSNQVDICTKNITINSLGIPSPTIFAQEPLPPTGSSETMLGIGILGAIFTIIGTALFILL